MNGLGEIIVRNARAAGKEAFAFSVYVVVDPAQVRETSGEAHRPVEEIVRDEIDSALSSVDYVDSVIVNRKTV